MMQKEQERRAEAWKQLTEEQKALAESELNAIYAWDIAETDKAFKKIKEEGRFFGGLDGYYPELFAIREERKQRVRALQEKYLKLAEERMGRQ